ncbi:MAG TPA: ABC transporter ATP-binding protein [Candidatus Binatia bacterium]|nr:ABC transporter ATP-binding protein [Candidatus Binatia bacterium]
MVGQIQIIDVSKAFTIRHNKTESLKSQVIGVFYKRYREQKETLWALRDVSLNIAPGEAFGLVGRNGSGKSTLLKVIAGIYPPTKGKVDLPKGARIGTMIELGVGFHPELTGKENIFLGASIHGLSRKEIEDIYAAVVEFSELNEFMDTPIKNYSSGMHARLGFALAVQLDPDVLLVDEVLAVGDEAFQQKCMDQIELFRAQGKTIIFVSHSADTVKVICDRACVLDHGRLVFLGKAVEAIERYHQLLAQS